MVTLDHIMQPLGVETFTRDYLRQTWLHLQQPAAVLDELVSVEVLNDSLPRLRFAGDRFRLFKGGEQVPPKRYFDEPQRSTGARINPTGLMQQVRSGATLVLDFVEELFPPITAFVEDCERALGVSTSVNLYLSCSVEPGFARHWDDHDVIILQIEGKKRWTVCAPTVEHPVLNPLGPVPPSPSSAPVFDDDLVPGSVLYLPRGWWHVARPAEPPSLHLTVGLGKLAGVDFLRWAATHLFAQSVGRQDMPVRSDPQGRREWIRGLQNALAEVLSEPDITERFEQNGLKHQALRRPLNLRRALQPTPVQAPKSDGDGAPREVAGAHEARA